MTAYYNEIDPMIVYLITNVITKKQYVGFTAQTLRRRWLGHTYSAAKGVKTALHSAIRKYGIDAFLLEQMESCATRVEADSVEVSLIRALRTRAPFGYNLTDGGEGVVGLSKETLRRIAEINTGRHHTAEARKRIGDASIGRRKTKEAKAAIGNARRGKPLSIEHRKKLAAAKVGKKMPSRSAEHKMKISAGLVAAHARKREGRDGCLLQ